MIAVGVGAVIAVGVGAVGAVGVGAMSVEHRFAEMELRRLRVGEYVGGCWYCLCWSVVIGGVGTIGAGAVVVWSSGLSV